MKIAFLSFYSGQMYRGVETFVHELANRLVAAGHDVYVYQGGKKLPGAGYRTITIKVEVNSDRKGSYTPFVNYWSRKVRVFTARTLKLIPDDVDVIFPTNGQWESYMCKFWAKSHGAKMVIAGQSGPGRDDRINLYSFPDTFVGLTDHQVNWAKSANRFVKVEKIPNGVDIGKFKGSTKPISLGLPKPIILSVAAFDKWKRLDLAIRAVARLDKVSLLLVGKGSELEKLKKLGKRLLGDRFQILSFPHHQMPRVYTTADLFTYPTVPWESFGIVLVEAMASGLPVVATRDKIRQEIVGDAGILVDPTNTEAYADALKRVLSTKWGDRPRLQASKFDWDLITKQYEKLFKSLL
jgi:glycosyltransferase involved in cell wall biosynthesis